jgi:uncharacterized protein (TIGR01777 family)
MHMLNPKMNETAASAAVCNRRVVIAGGSGFLGLAIATHLNSLGAEIVILSRSEPPAGPWTHVPWDGRTPGDWQRCLDGAAGLINLAGRSVDCIKTPEHQDEILRSRVESTRVLGVAMRQVAAPPPTWVQMSTAHIYGDPPSAWCDEDSTTGYGLAPFVGKAWEEAFRDSVLPTQRQVILRTSFVLGRDRGAGASAMNKLLPLARCGLGGRVGSGRQGLSWIHEVDLCRIMTLAVGDRAMQGTWVASAPHPVSQAEFMRELRRVVGMPIGLPATEWMVRLGARWLLRTDPELALYGRFVRSRRLAECGFSFQFPQLPQALANLYAR